MFGSDASPVRGFQLLCLTLQSDFKVMRKLAQVAASLKACSARLSAVAKKHNLLGGLFSLVQYTVGSVASRLIQPMQTSFKIDCSDESF